MAFKNLNEFITELEQVDDLKRITAPVDPNLEITEIADRVMKSPGGGQALLFENVQGSELPLLINTLGSRSRMCRALGVSDFTEIADRIAELIKPEVPATFTAKIKNISFCTDFFFFWN